MVAYNFLKGKKCKCTFKEAISFCPLEGSSDSVGFSQHFLAVYGIAQGKE